jgi:SAM-dependent MidA family methyltransferase
MWEKRGAPDRRKLLELGAAAGTLEAQLATLYGQVSTGALEMEES